MQDATCWAILCTGKEEEYPQMSSELLLSEFYKHAETRAQGQAFYPVLLEWARNSDVAAGLVLSFEKTEFVSSSFLDETIVRLFEEEPSLAERLRVASVDAFTQRMLAFTLKARGIQKQLPIYEPA